MYVLNDISIKKIIKLIERFRFCAENYRLIGLYQMKKSWYTPTFWPDLSVADRQKLYSAPHDAVQKSKSHSFGTLSIFTIGLQ